MRDLLAKFLKTVVFVSLTLGGIAGFWIGQNMPEAQTPTTSTVQELSRGEWYTVSTRDVVYDGANLWVRQDARATLASKGIPGDRVMIGHTGRGNFDALHALCSKPGVPLKVTKRPSQGYKFVHYGSSCVQLKAG